MDQIPRVAAQQSPICHGDGLQEFEEDDGPPEIRTMTRENVGLLWLTPSFHRPSREGPFVFARNFGPG